MPKALPVREAGTEEAPTADEETVRAEEASAMIEVSSLKGGGGVEEGRKAERQESREATSRETGGEGIREEHKSLILAQDERWRRA